MAKSKTIYIGAGTLTTITAIFLYLQFTGLVKLETSPDITCAGTPFYSSIYNTTISDCQIFVNVTTLNKTIYLKNKFGVELDFSPKVQGYQMFIKKYGKWKHVTETSNFTFTAYKKYELMFFVFKEPKQTVKWGVTAADQYIDPILYGIAGPFRCNVSIYLNGASTTQSYEYQTTANVTATTNCSNVNVTIVCNDCPKDSQYEWSSVNRTTVNYQFSTLRNTNFTSGPTMITPANFSIDNRTDLISVRVNLTGVNSTVYPSNFNFYTQGVLFAVFPGTFYGHYLTQTNFTYSSVVYSAVNLSYSTGSSQNIFVNITTTSASTNYTNATMNMKLTEFNVDQQNAFSYTENFTNTTQINTTMSSTPSNEFLFENYENVYTNTSGRWSFSSAASAPYTWDSSNEGFVITTPKSYWNWNEAHGGSFGSCGIWEFNGYKDNNETDFRISNYYNLTLYRKIQNCPYGPLNDIQCNSLDATLATFTLGITDGSTFVSLVTDTAPEPTWTGVCNCGVASGDLDYVIRKVGTNSYAVWKNGTYYTTVDTSSLSPSNTWRLRTRGYVKTHIISGCGVGGTEGGYGLIEAKEYSLKFGGVGLYRDYNATNYTTTSGFLSSLLNTTTTNISGATLTIVKSNFPTGTSAKYYLSNNRTTWEEVVNATYHVFSSKGNTLYVNISLNSSNKNVSPIITEYKVEIVPGQIQNMIVDIGADGTLEYNSSTILNNTQLNLSYYGCINYINTYCSASKTCSCPITFTSNSSGILQINNLNFTLTPNPISLNTTLFENCNVCNITSDNSGVLNLTDLKVDFRGSKNFTWVAQVFNNSGNATSNYTSIIAKVYYSKFNMSLPTGIFYVDFFPKSKTSKNVTPYGQGKSIPIFNVTSLAYDQPFNLYMRTNLTNVTCIQTFFINNYSLIGINKTYNLTNVSSLAYPTNISPSIKVPLWNWIDLNNCSNRYILPYWLFTAHCQGCVVTSDYDQTDFIW